MSVAVSTIAILIACHNRRETTLVCLAGIRRQQVAANLSVFVFDDGSSDGTGEAVRRFDPDAVVIRGDGTAFWAGAMRVLFDRALAQDFDHYLWLNDDVVLDPDAIARLLAAERSLRNLKPRLVGGAVRDPVTGAFTYGGILRRLDQSTPLRFEAVPSFHDRPRVCDTLHGNVVLVPAETARAIGSIGLAFVHTLGDLDYGLRVKQAGGLVVLAPGYAGTCAGNPTAGRWFQPDTPVRERWRLLAHPLGFPLRPWLAFARAHAGPLWPLFAALPFWRLFIPTALMGRVRRGARWHVRAA